MNNNSDTSSNSINNPSISWFRSIPRRIRRFISKQNRQSNHHQRNSSTSNIDGGMNSGETVITDPLTNGINEIEPSPEDTSLYSMVDYLNNANDEEVAMIRACSHMARYGWFWGPISRQRAQQRLHGMPNGSFLVRNSQINLHNFTISFRTAGKTLHYRIEFVEGYWQTFNSKHRSIVDLIEDAMKKSTENVFCYVKQNSQLQPPFPVRLTNPISHFGDIPTLQNMCRLVIQKNVVDIVKMDLLPLPNKLITYCKEWETIYGEMPIRIP